MAKNPAVNTGDARDLGSILGSGKSLEQGNVKPIQYSYLGNPMDRGVWQATAHRVSKSRTQQNTHRLLIRINRLLYI